MLLMRYLSGDLSDDDASELEQAVLIDGDLCERLEMVENDLVDAYVRGELSGAETKSFESRFLASAEGRERVAMARGLLAAVDRRPAPVASPETLWQRFSRLLASPTRTPQPAWAAVVVLAVGLTWLGRDLLPSDPVGPGPIRPDPIASDPVEAPGATETVTLVLSRARDAGEPPRVALAPEAGVVELQVDLEGEEARRFRARLESVSGDQIQRWRALAPRVVEWGRVLGFEVSADQLPPGRYLVTVERADSFEGSVEVGRYAFEIVPVVP